ncbi:hypothetical protein BGZ76_004273, partial [Entomortierella beljakovae]
HWPFGMHAKPKVIVTAAHSPFCQEDFVIETFVNIYYNFNITATTQGYKLKHK